MDVAVGDCEDLYQILSSPEIDEEKKKRVNNEINGWIEAAFDEYLE